MTILATIIVLGVLIFVHELGHFGAAKAVGIRVERFSIGLGPRVAGFRWGDTDYVLSAIPLGGYVKMGGMDDEVMERMEGGESEPREPSDSDYDAKPVWARAIVISAGVFMNMVFAFAAYTAVAAFWGTQVEETTRLGGVREQYLTEGAQALNTLPAGVEFERIGDRAVENWNDIEAAFLEGTPGPTTVEVSDPSMTVEVRIPESREQRVLLALSLEYWMEPVLSEVVGGSPAAEGGLEAGDRITAVDGQPVDNWSQFTRVVRARPGERLEVGVDRDGRELVRYVTPERVTEPDPVTGESWDRGQIGVRAISSVPVRYERMPAGEAVVAGWNTTVAATTSILSFLKNLFTGGVSARSVGSIVTIGQASGQAAQMGLEYFLQFMALFSVNLAILNLLPIPVLDGGHLVFLAIEAVRGRALSVEQRLRWSNVGFFIIMALMVWALGNDLLRVFGL